MSKNSNRIKNDLIEDVPASTTANVADIDAPIGMKNPKKQLMSPTNDYIKQNEKDAPKPMKFKSWIKMNPSINK